MFKTSPGSSNNNSAKYTQVNKQKRGTKSNGTTTIVKQFAIDSSSSQDDKASYQRSKTSNTNATRGNNFDHQDILSDDFIKKENKLDESIESGSVSNENNKNQVLEEVYICNCCGVSKELNPSIRYMSTYRCIFFLFNFLVFTFGLANFGLGLWFRIDPKVYEIHKYVETQNFTNAGWLLLFTGFLACLMSFVGFIGVAKQAISLLVFYFTIVILLTISFVGTLTLLTVYGLGASLEQFMIKEIYEQMRRRSMLTEVNSFQTTDAAQFMDFIQVKMHCCGATDFRDYFKLGMTVPTTCYTIDKNYINAPGCGHAIRQLLDLRAGLAAGFTLGSVLAQLITIISSAVIFCSIYHYRAIPRTSHVTISPQPRESLYHDHLDLNQSPTGTYKQECLPQTNTTISRDPSPIFERVNNYNLHHLERPRSRTPIII